MIGISSSLSSERNGIEDSLKLCDGIVYLLSDTEIYITIIFYFRIMKKFPLKHHLEKYYLEIQTENSLLTN